MATGPFNFWRFTAYLLLLLLALGGAAAASMYNQFSAQVQYLQRQLATTPHIRYVSVLLDNKNQPAMLATFDPADEALQLQRLNSVQGGREDSMQMWALTDSAAPRSLGVLQSSALTLSLGVPEEALKGVSQLAISVEDRGGAEPGHKPRLPWLFSGALISKAR